MAYVGLLEDNARIAKLCATMLRYAGHQVVIYQHPQDCLDALLPGRIQTPSRLLSPSRTVVQPVDVLILDLHLPDMTGIEVLHILLADPITRALPVIFCTAATSSEIAMALRIAPKASFVEKPFTFQELVKAIEKALTTGNK